MRRAVLFVAILVVISGCVETGPSNVEVALNGQPEAKSTEFTFDGTLGAESHATNEEFTFRNVSIVLYDEEGRVISSKVVGALSTNSSTQTVTITSGQVPAYVIVESPDFWNHSVQVNVKSWRRTDSGFQQYWITSENDKFRDESE